MAGKLIVVEGASASGKDTLLNALADETMVVMRALASQNQAENISLLPEAQKILGETILNFREVLGKPAEERDNIFKRFIQIAGIQQEEAIRRMEAGHTVYLNRSAISLDAILTLPSQIAKPEEKEYWETWTEEMLRQAAPIKQRLTEVASGIILMRKAAVGGVTREGMRDMESPESALITREARRIHQEHHVPLLELDATQLSIEEEVRRVREQLFV